VVVSILDVYREPMTGDRQTVLQLDKITKRFGALVANDAISLGLRQGEVLALLGENGAGKTTLMNIIFGHYVADAGSVEVFGKRLAPGSPRAALEAGIGMVHQHFTLAPNLTVLENIETGTESLWRPTLARRRARETLNALASRFGLAVDPDALVGNLAIGERQRVEILRVLYRKARILVLDEPTAVLTPQEGASLFAILRRMASDGLSIIFIGHKLDEVRGNADRILVLRAGALVGERLPGATSRDELAELMVGHRVVRPRRDPVAPGGALVEITNVSLVEGRRRVLDGIDLLVREREILGVVGVSGNGQTALADLVSGLAVPSSGTLKMLGRRVTRRAPGALVAAGVARVPEDRLAVGIVGDMAVWQNAIIERVATPGFSRCGLIRRHAAIAYANELVERYDIRGGQPYRRARLLSGGNLQRLILGRNLAGTPRLVIANQPTRGLDEGAVAGIHVRLLEARGNGAGVLLITEDLDEVLQLADRIVAIHRGRLSSPIPGGAADARKLGLMMAGHWAEAAHAV
jgi:general nucleoside transport system ATP-binding protein